MKIFISRALSPDSPFWQLGHPLTAISLVDIQSLDFGPLPESDFLFFYSRNGVRCFFEGLPEGSILPKIATLGAGTAEELLKYTQKIDFIGDGEPENVAKAFLEVGKGQKICFVHGLESVQSVRKAIENQIIALDLCVYANRPLQPQDGLDANAIILTSPMNTRAYFEARQQKNNTQTIDFVVVIGKTTQKAVIPYYDGPVYIASQPNEAGLLDALQAGLKKANK